jgi:hypothetical protein
MASGQTVGEFFPEQNQPPASNFATRDTRGSTNPHTVLDFDASTAETAIFKGIMPSNYSGGGVTVYIHYAMTSAASGDIDWDVAFERIGDQGENLDNDGFAAVKSVDTTTVPGTAGLVDVVSINFSNGSEMDSVIAGDSYRIKVTRDAPNDSATGDAELWGVEMREQ